jgi:A/G-specific adenine glycosylase
MSLHPEPTGVPAAASPAVLHDRVLRWYDEHARDLPWRAPEATPWGILVSEAMLQQTPVARVLPVWLSWMERWPAPVDLVAAGPGEAVRAWGRLGYPRRALRLHAAATAIVDQHDGEVPDDHAALLALPGIGDYTASAVASFAFGRRHVVLDTNVRRVLGRVVAGEPLPGPSPTRAERERAAALLPEEAATAAAWAVGVMELGALVCRAVGPRCAACPVSDLCRWRAAGQPPETRPRRVQGYAGTDRQVRGRLLAVLRDSTGPVHRSSLEGAWPEAVQRERCLATLLEDGLVVSPADGVYALP